jgi:small conductance mechanosensitive channel
LEERIMDRAMDWLTPQFWAGILQSSVAWAFTAVPAIVAIVMLAFLLGKLLRLGCRQLAARVANTRSDEPSHLLREQQKRADTLIGILEKAGRIVIAALIGMLLLMQVGVNVAPLIAGAGVLGLAVGFGAQELVRDVITGFFILMENHMRVGDVAVINGTGGLVESIGLRTIVLRDLAGVVHIFQNGKIATLSNMTKEWSAMVFDVGVAYKEDTDRVVHVMREVAESLQEDPVFGEKIIEPMEIFGVDSFGDNAVVLKARLKTQPIEQWSVGREYRRRLKKAFDARGIEIPVPCRTLYFGEASPPLQRVSLRVSGMREHDPSTQDG